MLTLKSSLLQLFYRFKRNLVLLANPEKSAIVSEESEFSPAHVLDELT